LLSDDPVACDATLLELDEVASFTGLVGVLDVISARLSWWPRRCVSIWMNE